MALSEEAVALKEQALHAADTALASRTLGPGPAVRSLIAAAWLDGYKTGQLENDRYVDEAHRYLLGLAS